MRKKISVLVVDDNIRLGDNLAAFLASKDAFKVVGVARDGFEAIDLIKKSKPDVVTLDVIMPNLDGIGVLEKVASLSLEKKPLFLMVTAIGQEKLILKAMELGAEYYIVKPFDEEILIERLLQIYEYEHKTSNLSYLPQRGAFNDNNLGISNENLTRKISDFLHKLGMPPHLSGFQFVRSAILMRLKDSGKSNSVTKVIYPEIAKEFNTTASKVERSIRNAVEKTWQRGNDSFIDKLFGDRNKFSTGKPTNSEFMATIADRIKYEIKK